jgi:uncharacterized membrane protein HdeD (DUF308 family)
MLSHIGKRWWVLLLRGLCAISLGVCALVWPGITLLALIYLFALFALIDGVASIVLGFRGEADGTVWWTMVVLGALAIAAGVTAFAWPGLTAVVLLVIIAVSAIVRGVFEIAAAISLRKEIEGEWLLALSGVLSVLFGALLISRPGAGALAVVWLIGAYMIALGLVAAMLSFKLRGLGKRAAKYA